MPKIHNGLWCAVLTVATVAFLSGCGDAPEPPRPTSTVTATVTSAESASESGESREDTPTTSSTSEAEPDATTTEGPSVLTPMKDKDRALTLADIFRSSESDDWVDDRFEIASRPDVRGMAVETRNCSRDQAAGIELRLANGFDHLSLKVGQSNHSSSSDQVVKVEVVGNGQQLDVRTVAFNKVVPFQDVDVQGVNALKVLVYLDEDTEGCGLDPATIVIHDMKLS